MKKIKKILFPTDFSEPAQNAFRHALLLADRLKADLLLLHVVYPQAEALDTPILVAQATETHVRTARAVMKNFIQNGLTQVLQQMKNAPALDSNIEVGTPVGKIKEAVKSDDINLVVMGAKGKHSVIERMVGSVTAGVVGEVSCPVLVIPEEAKPKVANVIAYGTDLKDGDPYQIWKAIKLLDSESAIFRVVHINTDTVAFMEKEKLDTLKEFFEDQSPSLQIHFHHLPGKTAEEELLEFINLYDVDMMVMYQPKRTFIDRLFHRSHTKKMAAKTTVPLLVMKG